MWVSVGRVRGGVAPVISGIYMYMCICCDSCEICARTDGMYSAYDVVVLWGMTVGTTARGGENNSSTSALPASKHC